MQAFIADACCPKEGVSAPFRDARADAASRSSQICGKSVAFPIGRGYDAR